MRPFFDGLLTGLFLQLALGPIFFYVLGIALESNYINSLYGIAAVTLADYIFIVLSLVGIGRFLKDERKRVIFGVVSSILLILFGLIMLYQGLNFNLDQGHGDLIIWTPFTSFASCFVLTVSSPLTILFWGSIFSAKAIEKNYEKQQLIVFGLSAGISTFIFLAGSMMILTLFKSMIPNEVVQILNSLVGVVLIFYGISRIIKVKIRRAQGY